MGPKIVSLSGGVGGAKLSAGLAAILPPDDFSIIVNVADDFEWNGLSVSPDLDTVMYTLAGLENPDTGWGRADETFACMDELAKRGLPSWFQIGDRDMATHLIRSHWLWEGLPLTEVTDRLKKAHGLRMRILPATDDLFRTVVETDAGDLEFQEYFVHRHCEPHVSGFHWKGVASAHPTNAVLIAMQQADLIVICPSNPFVSIEPILQLPGMREAVASKPALAVSPLIGGKTIKGPAAKMFFELGYEPTSVEVAKRYSGLVRGFVVDSADREDAATISDMGMKVLATDTLMSDQKTREQLASSLFTYGKAEGWI
jgi:LPPG:FO 2-phospho-L-lactate transferase